MTDVHEALSLLRPTTYSDIDLSTLPSLVERHLSAATLIADSIPPPPDSSAFPSSTADIPESPPSSTLCPIRSCSTRSRSPDPTDRSGWGKSLRLSARDNPHDVSVYKMAARDKFGAWFARRSAHAGLSFERMRDAMVREFASSLDVSGGPGAGAVRGIAADERVEEHEVKSAEGDVLGKVQVWRLSAQFPGPTTPREFVTLLVTGDREARGAREFVVVSRPVEHEAVEERSGVIRGAYESVEVIREIPLHELDGRSREDNPVEWIMVTRSDPGGGIPRFMVERGTPAGIVGDVGKFFDWAVKLDAEKGTDGTTKRDSAKETNGSSKEITAVGKDQKVSDTTINPEVPAQEGKVQSATDTTTVESKSLPGEGGVLQSAQQALSSGVSTYAPAAVANWFRPQSPQPASDVSDTSSDDSDYESADDFRDTSQSTGSPRAGQDPVSSTADDSKHGSQRRKLDSKLEDKRAQEAKRLAAANEAGKNRSSTELAKARERHDREVRKAEERHEKDVSKLEERRRRDVDKARRKRDRQADKDVLGRVRRERDEFRARIDLVQRENAVLREQIASVQRENELLAEKVKGLNGGEAVMASVREEMGGKRSRSSTVRSSGSRA